MYDRAILFRVAPREPLEISMKNANKRNNSEINQSVAYLTE
jgi:hypothetical protein